ncbi:class 1 fructose-bisphosphatase [Neolewinella lacunae]|uniref:Fructose-1,6-bisphosphatase class 1 n=1 Tax=Neolewinella lacunae TaxID=1517758 RepID=A0A923T7P5_9BACT|nr:class 1 fructose-bisphosphatase [Neolewinella lacunae]MBC6993103.1 class 1 fructose-bisphosphatase [Neolewinella lacunae]MDN3635923.1 class 1 fructose-bisphosphatase [Neolewinella lacunae]
MATQRTLTLGEFLIGRPGDFEYENAELGRLLNAIRLAGKVVGHEINRAGLVDITGTMGTTNVQGEEQKKLDVFANEAFINTLTNRDIVCGIVSEENDAPIHISGADNRNRNKYVVVMDPLDGSSNIDVNITVGTIFGIYHRVSPIGTPVTLEDFLQPGNMQVAAGYIAYGTSTIMVYTTGNGVNGFTLNPAIGTYYLSHPNIQVPETGRIYSVNEGGYVHFPEGVKRYIKYCQAEEGDRPYTSRYVGSMVADIHRTLLQGGIYMYPKSSGREAGKLRLLYESNPVAFLLEQAGGRATDGFQRILDLKPTEIHQRTPFFGGSVEMVKKAEAFLATEG